MTAVLEGGEWSAARPGRTLPPEKTRYPFYRRLGGPQGRSGRAETLVPIGIRSRTIQPVVNRYTDWATRPIYTLYILHIYIVLKHRLFGRHRQQMGGTTIWSRSRVNGVLILDANDPECLILTHNGFQTQDHEHSNEACGSIKSRKYTDQLSNYQDFMKEPCTLSSGTEFNERGSYMQNWPLKVALHGSSISSRQVTGISADYSQYSPKNFITG